jgi:monovalent cation:proton antiporter-2 (CPA2) family protein
MIIFQLAVILLATKLAGNLSVKLGQPSVLGKLIIGIIIGPAVLGWVQDSEIIHVLSEIGVLLLMFIAGLETDLTELNRNRNSSLAVAIGGILFPLFGGYAAGMAMGMEPGHAIFLGLLLSATSVSISVQTLKELGQLNTRESTTLLGAAVVDDVMVLILLAFAMSFLGSSDVNLGIIFGQKLLFFISIFFVSWKAVPLFMRWLAPLKVTEPIISAALILCLFYAYYAELLGIAGIIGAFAAGIAVAQTSYKKEVEHRIEPIAYGVFVPVFFVSIGLSVSFAGVGEQLWFILSLTLLAILTKFVGAGLGARITGFNTRSSIGIGAGMISRGEVALILAAIGLEANLLAKEYFTPLIIVVILTTLVTPPLLKLVFSSKEGALKTAK